ncbi:MAG: GNAT family N-acetyltransferase [Firmicutes bacterium]|nr:GNAT family N-acetyltransferase [Bacillota bacterium]
MTHLGTLRLETERLILRRFVESDVTDMFNNWTNDPQVTKFLSWQPHGDISVTREFMKTRLEGYGRDDFYSWAMELKSTGRVIGTIAVGRHNDGPRSATIGYCMGRAWWNQGYMTEALRGVIQFLFGQVGMNRVEAFHDPRNPGSGRVMQKAGMIYEGTSRQSGMNNQGVCDEACYGILASEYKH